MSKTYQYRHSPHQSLVAHTGSVIGSDHSLDAPVVCIVFSNVQDHVSQIKGPGLRNQVAPGLSWDASGALRCVASLYATNTADLSVAVLQRCEICESGALKAHAKEQAELKSICAASVLPLRALSRRSCIYKSANLCSESAKRCAEIAKPCIETAECWVEGADRCVYIQTLRRGHVPDKSCQQVLREEGLFALGTIGARWLLNKSKLYSMNE
eukprot:2469035-Pleurochrysis_carterae.AAC.1